MLGKTEMISVKFHVSLRSLGGELVRMFLIWFYSVLMQFWDFHENVST